MDTLVLRVPLLSERGGNSRFGTLPPWRESVKDKLLIILSHCCFPQKLIMILALCNLMHTMSEVDLQKLFLVNQKVQYLPKTSSEKEQAIDVDIIFHPNTLRTTFMWMSRPDSTGPSALIKTAFCCDTIRSLQRMGIEQCSRAFQGRLVRLLQGTVSKEKHLQHILNISDWVRAAVAGPQT